MKLLTLINPYSGKKNSAFIFEKIKNIFENNNIYTHINISQYKGHIKKILLNTNLTNYNGIIIVGGDGTLNEAINGMLNRKDKMKLPIGVIPTGSGNSYMHDLNLTDPICATNTIIKNNITSVDVIKISTNNHIIYAMNMIGWGLVADIGKIAEKCRWLGRNRYTILSILEVLRKKKYFGKLIINNKTIENNFTFIIACNSIHIGRGMKMAPKAKLNDGLIDLITVKSNLSRGRLFQTLPKLFDGSHILEPEVSYYQTNSFSLYPKNNVTLNIDGEAMGKTPINVKVLQNKIDLFY